jgi:hypothetical protein
MSNRQIFIPVHSFWETEKTGRVLFIAGKNGQGGAESYRVVELLIADMTNRKMLHVPIADFIKEIEQKKVKQVGV